MPKPTGLFAKLGDYLRENYFPWREILVIIAILAILVGLMLPALASAKRNVEAQREKQGKTCTHCPAHCR